MKKLLILLAATTAIALPGIAGAQSTADSDLVVMRRTVAPAQLQNAPTHLAGTWVLGVPVVTPGCSAAQPTTATVTCQDKDGKTVAESRCADSKPTGLGTTPDYSKCTNAWAPSEYGDYSSHCSVAAIRSRTVTCQRSDGKPLDDSQCTGTKPATADPTPAQVLDGCNLVDWLQGGFGAYASTCSLTATTTRTQTVICTAHKDTADAGFPVAPDTLCTKSKPPTTDTPVAVNSGCNYNWKPSAWTNTSGVAACSPSVSQTRTVTCIRTTDQAVVDSKTYCSVAGSSAGAPPITTQTTYDYTGCTGVWVTGTTFTDTSSCAANSRKSQARNDTCKNPTTGAIYPDNSNCSPQTQPGGSTRQIGCGGTCNLPTLGNGYTSGGQSGTTSIPVGYSANSGAALLADVKSACENYINNDNNYRYLYGCEVISDHFLYALFANSKSTTINSGTVTIGKQAGSSLGSCTSVLP